jgi:hypothetical protein
MFVALVITAIGVPIAISLHKISSHMEKIEKNTAFLMSRIKKAERFVAKLQK